MHRVATRWVAWACAGAAFSAAGCAAGLSTFLAPEFLNEVGVGTRVAALPGDAPAVLLEVENRTGRVAEVQLQWREGDSDVGVLPELLDPGERVALALVCPIDEITLGDVSNLMLSGARIRLGDGGADDPFIDVEPFGVLLRDQANYNCGDIVTFAVIPSGATRSGYQIVAFIRRADAQ